MFIVRRWGADSTVTRFRPTGGGTFWQLVERLNALSDLIKSDLVSHRGVWLMSPRSDLRCGFVIVLLRGWTRSDKRPVPLFWCFSLQDDEVDRPQWLRAGQRVGCKVHQKQDPIVPTWSGQIFYPGASHRWVGPGSSFVLIMHGEIIKKIIYTRIKIILNKKTTTSHGTCLNSHNVLTCLLHANFVLQSLKYIVASKH